jgi:hypothetical protein
MSERVVTDRAERRAIFDAFFARAKGFGSRRGLADYIQERRREQHFPVMRGETYTGCSCREALCIWQYAIAWMDELVASYEVKVQEFAAETRRRRPAAAVPEAQDGRERENRWNDALNEANRRYGGHRRVVAPLLALADAEIAASAAVREGERERQIADLLRRCDKADEAAMDSPRRPDGKTWVGFLLTPSIRAALAAPSLAAPEGTEQ